ncbi:MAG: histidine phosphatase family protein [Anaerolineae bacterium]|nr:histidine phosphatase family protein [Anaerolineae bacterium]MCI0608923.1 histidine phosphatase family protein [Anaerolineae bacterium]
MSSTEKPIYHFVFLRHGESVGNVESRWQGQSDYPLTERGRAQAQALAKRWQEEKAKFDLVITSPLIRAKNTAEIVASALDVKVEADPLWMERNVGEMTGLTIDEIRLRPRPTFVTPYDTIGGVGEGDWVLFLRAGQALHSLLRRPAGRYLIVSHGGLLNQLMHAIVGIAPHADPSGVRFRFDNTAFARVFYLSHQHRWAIETLNDHVHLKSLNTNGDPKGL